MRWKFVVSSSNLAKIDPSSCSFKVKSFKKKHEKNTVFATFPTRNHQFATQVVMLWGRTQEITKEVKAYDTPVDLQEHRLEEETVDEDRKRDREIENVHL